MNNNRLVNENSPYLKQHKTNPVHWHPWDDLALKTARQEQKPILLSIGYSACHWCHVMAHESFEDQQTADLMNAHFVNIKIDREERPDLDLVFQAALSFLGVQGGWPLTMFLTPDGDPFWGGTYFPPQPLYGRPSFKDVLINVARLHDENPAGIAENVAALKKSLQSLNRPKGGDAWSLETIDSIAENLMNHVDPENGGLGGAPKFPQTGIFELLWRAYKRTGDIRFKQTVEKTLFAMCQGGIYDHLGGGFSRYCVDEKWLVPHFEKMLYDNAQLIELMTLVWQETKDPLLECRVSETIEWIVSDLATEAGPLASSYDADSEGREGAYYIWTENEVDTLLLDKSEDFKKTYNVTQGGNWEGVNILNRRDAYQRGEKEDLLYEARQILKKERLTREPPHRDDKTLTDWNGMAISAIARAGMAFNRQDWIETAATLFARVVKKLSAPPEAPEGTPEGLVHCAYEDGKTLPAILDDYSNMCRAALTLYEATGEAAYLARAEQWVRIVNRDYHDDETGGYFYSGIKTTDVLIRSKSATDHATPSGNGQMCEVLTKLHILTGREEYRQGAMDQAKAFSGDLAKFYPSMATLINATEGLISPLQILLTGKKGNGNPSSMWRVLKEMSLPNAVISAIDDPSDLHENHPARNMVRNGKEETAYICNGNTCLPAVTSTKDLIDSLGSL